MFQYDEKMPQLQERNSYDSKASYDSVSSSEDEKELLPPYGLVFYNRRLQNKPLPPLPTQSGRRVRFELEKPLPPLPGQSKTKRSPSRFSFGEQAWWVQSRFNFGDDLEDSMEKKIH